MNVVASAWTADRDSDQPSRRLGRDRRWDRRVALLDSEADVVVLDKITQRRPQIDPRTVLGRGKLDDLLIRSMRLGADLIIFDAELSPAQVRSLSEATDMRRARAVRPAPARQKGRALRRAR